MGNYKAASVHRRSKAVPLDAMFKTEVESVKQRNHRKKNNKSVVDFSNDNPEDSPEEISRWNRMSNSIEKTMEKSSPKRGHRNSAKTNLPTVEENEKSTVEMDDLNLSTASVSYVNSVGHGA